MQDHPDFRRRESDISAERLLLRRRKPLSALRTLKPLDFVLPVETRFHHLNTAVVARHAASFSNARGKLGTAARPRPLRLRAGMSPFGGSNHLRGFVIWMKSM